MAAATAPNDTKGGTMCKQVGLGSTIASIDTIHTQGSMQNTGRPLDLAIEGNGYFVVNNGENSYYTRAGNFYLDEQGNLINSGGYYLQSDNGNIAIPTDAQKLYNW